MSEMAFFIDHSRCIGCQSCVQACAECDTHRGVSMIHLETIQRSDSVQTAPQVCIAKIQSALAFARPMPLRKRQTESCRVLLNHAASDAPTA